MKDGDGRRKRESGKERKTQEDPGRSRELSGAEGGGGHGPGSWEGLEARPAQGVLERREGEQEDRDGGEGAARGQGERKAGRGGEGPREGAEGAGPGVPSPEEASSICNARCGATDTPGRGF